MATLPKTETEVPKEGVERVYCLHYRMGNKPPAQKNFNHKGDLKSASTRAREHCTVMGLVYIFTAPFIVDLEHQERVRLEDPGHNFEERR